MPGLLLDTPSGWRVLTQSGVTGGAGPQGGGRTPASRNFQQGQLWVAYQVWSPVCGRPGMAGRRGDPFRRAARARSACPVTPTPLNQRPTETDQPSPATRSGW